jgi:hypothetical protein
MDLFFLRKPSNDRDWRPDVATIPLVEISGTHAKVHNVRNFHYRSVDDFDMHFEDREYDLDGIDRVEIGVVPFHSIALIAHLLLIFKFTNGQSVVFSAEVRKRNGQKFVAWQTAWNNYELAYLILEETDAIDLRLKHRIGEPIHVYELALNHEQAKQLFIDYSQRANKIAEHPEFFNLFFNSCGSNVIGHINQVVNNKIPFYYRYFAPGYLGRFLVASGLGRDKGVMTAPPPEPNT